jgi:hypothetical protein
MKLTLILLFGLILINISNAQERDDLYYTSNNKKQNKGLKSVPKHVSKIIIHNKFNRTENFQIIGETLVENNYQIDKADKEFWTISTIPKTHEKRTLNYILYFAAKDSLIVISGTFKTLINNLFINPDNPCNFLRIENIGMKGSPLQDSFKKMYLFSERFPNTSKIDFLNEQDSIR